MRDRQRSGDDEKSAVDVIVDFFLFLYSIVVASRLFDWISIKIRFWSLRRSKSRSRFQWICELRSYGLDWRLREKTHFNSHCLWVGHRSVQEAWNNGCFNAWGLAVWVFAKCELHRGVSQGPRVESRTLPVQNGVVRSAGESRWTIPV